MKGAETQVNMVVVRRQRHPALSGLPACSLLTLCLSCALRQRQTHRLNSGTQAEQIVNPDDIEDRAQFLGRSTVDASWSTG